MAAADRVLVDLGTGDGRAAVRLARREPTAFVIGLDASSAAMAESSWRAARPESKGGRSNVLFAVAAAERPPDELCPRADEVTILFPWGSLLRGVLALDPAAAAGSAALVAPGGTIRALVSVAERDAGALGVWPLTVDDRELLARRWAAFGLELAAFEPASDDEIEASGSTWARRLLAGRRPGAGHSAADRAVWRIELRRCDHAPRMGPVDEPR
jgi:16S rRNA (adenine(1408)-N(1))-methyltransferase